MTFSQLKQGDNVHILEVLGTFKKNTAYSLGNVISVSQPYDEPIPPSQFPMPMPNRRKLVDVVISCDGEQKKLSVSEDKSIMTDNSIGLTIAIDKSQIINVVRQSYNNSKLKIESISRYEDEMRRCKEILAMLSSDLEIPTNVTNDFKQFEELRAEVKELKELIHNLHINDSTSDVGIEPPVEEEEIK